MSTNSIGFYTRERYGDGCFAFYYDFENYEGDYILTTGSGDYSTYLKYSGKIEGDVTSFKYTEPGSGAFNLLPGDDNYIKIENILPDDDLMKPAGWTFLVSQEKIDNTCGTIFSNFAGEQFSTSGWEIGINNANQLYFKYQDALLGDRPGTPYDNIITLNVTSAAKNYYAITYAANSVELARYDPQSRQWDSQLKPVRPSYIRNNKDWYIGTGEYPYVGYIDKFAFFNIPITKSDLAGIIDASYKDLDFNNGAESLTVSGDVIGFETFPTGETGVLMTSGAFSGYKEYTVSGNNLISDPLKGYVPSGSGYFEPSGLYSESGNNPYEQTGEFYKRVLAPEDLFGAVTGFNVYESGYESTFSEPVYSGIEITGVVWSGSGVGEEIRSPDEVIVINQGSTVLTGEGSTGDYSYNKDTLSYLGQRGEGTNIFDGEEGDFIEYIFDTYEDINFNAQYGYSNLAGREAFFIDGEYRDRGEDINLFLNGVYQITGALVEGPPDPLNPLNPNAPTVTLEDGNYALDQTTVRANQAMFSQSDKVIYDQDLSEINGRLEITDVSQYFFAPFAEIETNDSTIYFNGQKIYRGIDWQDVGGFTPIGDILTMVGVFESRSSYETDTSVNLQGIDLYDIRNNSGENFIAFINGVRAPREDFIYYSSGVNLIDGRKNLVELPQRPLYNITAYNTFF